jgi:predicted glycosyltransferase
MSHKLRRLTTVAYAVNGSGLGHLTRVLAILRWMKRLALLSGVSLEAYVLTSSEAPGLALEEGFAAFKIPSKTAIRKAGLPKDDYLRLARQWVWHSLGLIKPDLLLVDTFPGGSFGELINALDIPGARVFINRAMKEDFARAAGVEKLLSLYDRILIPIEPTAPQRAFDTAIAAKTRHVGPIMLRSYEELHPREEARRRLGIPENKLGVWLSAGGGGDLHAGDGIETLVETLRDEPDLHLVVGAGPLHGGTPLRGGNITWLTCFNAMEDFAGIDFAVSAAGYNSFHELLHTGVPTAFFAQEKIADEQERRVRVASEVGCALSINVERDGKPNTQDIRLVLEAFRNPQLRAEIAQKARDFIPVNSARDAAFEALATVLPHDALEDALEVGSPHFFLALSRGGVELEDVERINRRLMSVNGLDAEERREMILRLVSMAGTKASTAARVFQALAHRVHRLTREEEAEELVGAVAQIVAAVSSADERALLELLRALPKDEQSSPAELAASLSGMLRALDARGDSISRGRAILARHLAEAAGGSPLADILKAVTGEIQNGSLMPTNFKLDALSGENQESHYGD